MSNIICLFVIVLYQKPSRGHCDLSFLDDLDIDEIVKCLNTCDNISENSKETDNKSVRNNNITIKDINRSNIESKKKSHKKTKISKEKASDCIKKSVNNCKKNIIEEKKKICTKTELESKVCHTKKYLSSSNFTRITLHIKAIKKKQNEKVLINQEKKVKYDEEISKSITFCENNATSINESQNKNNITEKALKNSKNFAYVSMNNAIGKPENSKSDFTPNKSEKNNIHLDDPKAKNTKRGVSQNYKRNIISEFVPQNSTDCVTKLETANDVIKAKSGNAHISPENINLDNINIGDLSDFEDYDSKVNEHSSLKDLTTSKKSFYSTIRKPHETNHKSKEIKSYLEPKISVHNVDTNIPSDKIIDIKQSPKKYFKNIKKNKSENNITQQIKKSGNLKTIPQSSLKVKPEIKFIDLTEIDTKVLHDSENVGATQNNNQFIKNAHKCTKKSDSHLLKSTKNINNGNISPNINKSKIKEPMKEVITYLPKSLNKISKNYNEFQKNICLSRLPNANDNSQKNIPLGSKRNEIKSTDNIKQIIVKPHIFNLATDIAKKMKNMVGKNTIQFRSEVNTQSHKHTTNHSIKVLPLLTVLQEQNYPIDKKDNVSISENELKCEDKNENENQYKTTDKVDTMSVSLNKNDDAMTINDNKGKSINTPKKHINEKEIQYKTTKKVDAMNVSLNKNDDAMTINDNKGKSINTPKIHINEKETQYKTAKKVDTMNVSLNKNDDAMTINDNKEKSITGPKINIFKKNSGNIKSKDDHCPVNNTARPQSVVKPKEDIILSDKLKNLMNKYSNKKYSAFSIIHNGKFSKIFKCKYSDGQLFAVKLLRSLSEKTINKNDRMLNQILKDIPRKNLFCVYIIHSFTLDNGFWCYLMEYYPKNMKNVLIQKKTPFHIGDVQNLTRQLVAAITLLRCHGIVHSDIKPSHILLDHRNRNLKLCGFDDAYYEKRVVLLPSIGTASYRPPEVIMGHSAGFKIDVWATAIVMYEMITGQKLFPGTNNNDILFEQMSVLGNMPYDMIIDSMYKATYFINSTFLRTVGDKGKDVVKVQSFIKSNKILLSVNKSYDMYWRSKRNKTQQEEDKMKFASFYKLLKQMLVLHPAYRLSIEFVHANPFLFEANPFL